MCDVLNVTGISGELLPDCKAHERSVGGCVMQQGQQRPSSPHTAAASTRRQRQNRPTPAKPALAAATKQQRQALNRGLPPSDWADARPGVWVRDWFIQQQDTVCMMVQGEDVGGDSLTFHVRRGAATQHVRLFRVEEVLASEGVLVARFYCNAERSLQQPLRFTARSERLPLEQLSRACYTLAPNDEWEVVQRLLGDQYCEMCEHLSGSLRVSDVQQSSC